MRTLDFRTAEFTYDQFSRYVDGLAADYREAYDCGSEDVVDILDEWREASRQLSEWREREERE